MFDLNCSPSEKHDLLTERAIATAWLLIDEFDRRIPEIWQEYVSQCGDVLGFSPKPLTIETYRRILVECLSWGAYYLVQNELNEHFTRRKMMFKTEPDLEKIGRFYSILEEDLDNYLSPFIREMHEIKVTLYQPLQLGEGRPLSVATKIHDYLNAPTPASALETFVEQLALSIDSELLMHTRKVAYQSCGSIQRTTANIVEQVFSYRQPAQKIKKALATTPPKIKPDIPQETITFRFSLSPNWAFAYAYAQNK